MESKEKKNEDKLESLFAQKSEKKPVQKAEKPEKKPREKRACHCCGKPGCYPKKCDKKDSISEAEWYIHTGVVLNQTIIDDVEVDDNPTGFSGLQYRRREGRNHLRLGLNDFPIKGQEDANK